MSVAKYLKRPHLAQFPFAFIVTIGRSGSTLLQGILNSIPGYRIGGENYSTLFYLFVAAQHIEEAHGRFGTQKTNSKQSWFGADQFDPEVFSRSLADAFLDACLKPDADTRCVGFKEVRYLQSDIPDELFPAYLDFLQAVFPGAALIFNVRNVADTALSGWWKDRDPQIVEEQLTRAIERFESYAAKRSNCILFSYDSLIADAAYCETLFDFLGEPFDRDALMKQLVQSHGFMMPRGKKNESASAKVRFVQGESLGVEAALVANLRKSVEAKSVEIDELREEVATQRLRIQDLRGLLQVKDEKLLSLRARLHSIEKSRSWRLTGPLRRISQVLRETA